MKKFFKTIAATLAVLTLASCGGSNKVEEQPKDNHPIDYLRLETVNVQRTLTAGADINLIFYVKTDDYLNDKDILNENLKFQFNNEYGNPVIIDNFEIKEIRYEELTYEAKLLNYVNCSMNLNFVQCYVLYKIKSIFITYNNIAWPFDYNESIDDANAHINGTWNLIENTFLKRNINYNINTKYNYIHLYYEHYNQCYIELSFKNSEQKSLELEYNAKWGAFTMELSDEEADNLVKVRFDLFGISFDDYYGFTTYDIMNNFEY